LVVDWQHLITFDSIWHLLKAIESIGKDLTTLDKTWQHLRWIGLDRVWDLKRTMDHYVSPLVGPEPLCCQ
jgi:hypothetical protein